jgi:PPOX class probable F420-dependent enzyme
MTKNTADDLKFLHDFLNLPLIARMATADLNGQPHVVPVWFGWDGDSIWISSYSNTRKIGDLRKNPKISISIDGSDNVNHPQAVILEGQVELIEQPRVFLRKQFYWIYTRYLGENGVLEKDPQEWIEDPHNLLIKLKPQRTIINQ